MDPNKDEKDIAQDKTDGKKNRKFDKRYKGKRNYDGNTNPKRGKRDDGKKGIPWKNDWQFYAVTERIAKDIASYPYNKLPGSKFNIPWHSGTFSNFPDSTTYLPNFCVLSYVPGVGNTNDDANAGINIATKQLYTYVRHANSGARNYEGPDIMMYVLAMRDIYTRFFEAKRALGIAYAYYFENKSFPDSLLRSIGIDPQDLRGNLAQYRGRLNLLAAKINSFAVPKYFKAFDRAAFISSYYFTDSTSIRGQAYIFRTAGYYTWSGTTSTQGTSLQFNFDPSFNSTSSTPAFSNVSSFGTVYLDTLEDQLDALFYDDDANTMAGDILKAFDQSNLYQIADVPDPYVVLGTYDEDILAQIENSFAAQNYSSSTFASTFTKEVLAITQENQIIKAGITLDNTGTASFPNGWYFNSHKDAPEFSDNLEWSRLIVSATKNSSSWILHYGLELLLNITIVNMDPQYDDQRMVYSELNQSIATASNGSIASTALKSIAKLAIFDWHPGVYFIEYNMTGTDLTSSEIFPFMDLKFYTVLTDKEIHPTHDSACMAAFYAKDLYNKAQ
nr:MAG TPA: capsid [Picobirnaviridae sp.]